MKMDPASKPSRTSILLADLLYIVHLLVLVFLLVGWALSGKWLYVYVLTFPAIVVTWKLTGACPLTTAENRLRGVSQSNRFIENLLKKLGVSVSTRTLNFLEYAIPAGLWVVGVGRLIWSR